MKRPAAASCLERIDELMNDVAAPLERVQELQDIEVALIALHMSSTGRGC